METFIPKLQNVGGIKFTYKVNEHAENFVWSRLIARVKDKKSKALFKDVFEICSNKLDKDLLVIDVRNFGGNYGHFSINNAFIPLDREFKATVNNLPFFSQIGKLTDFISKSTEKFPMNPKYLDSYACKRNLDFKEFAIPGTKERYKQEYPMEKIYEFNNVKNVASYINKFISNAASEYLKF